MNNKKRASNKGHELYRAIFVDLCTVSEMKAMEQRFQVARMLSRGMVYHDILEQTGASSATISRVNRSLRYGNDGYEVVFQRLAEQEGKTEDKGE